MTPLTSLKPGQKARVIQVRGEGEVRRRIIDMGVTPGTLIEIERVAPLGDPIQVRLKGFSLALRRGEAEGLKVERL